MGTTAEKFNYAFDTKDLLKTEINKINNVLDDNSTFRSYPQELFNGYLDILNNGTDTLWNNLEKVSASGETPVLENVETAPIKMVLNGNTSQDGTPTPDTPVEVKVVKGENVVSVSGKNLFDKSLFQNFTDAIKFILLNLKPNTQYTVSSDIPSSYNSANLFALNSTGNPSTITNGVTPSITRTITTLDDGILRIGYRDNGNVLEDEKNNYWYQVEEGSTATPYVPYSKTDYPINLDPNLADLSTFENGYVNGTNGSNVGSSTRGEMMSPYIKVKPNTTYTFAIIKTEGTETSWFGIGYYTTNDTSGFIIRQVSEKAGLNYYTFTTLENTEYIRVSARNLTTATKVQLVEGISTQELPIELCKINTYKDYFHKDSGKWYVHKEIGKVVLDENTIFEGYQSFGNYYRGQKKIQDAKIFEYNNIEIFSNNFKGNINVFTSTKAEAGNMGQYKNTIDFYFISTQPTKADFKTWLSTHNTIVYYVLATPTEEEITNTTLIEQLEAISNAKSVKDKTYITQENDELPFILDVEAVKEYEVV